MSSESNIPVDSETQEMLGSFVSEAFDSLDTNEPKVEFLRENDNSDHVNAIFRVFHTLKGLSGFFEMKIINKVTHEAETLLDYIRKQNIPQTEDTITVIYQTFDFLRDLLQRVNTEHTDLSGAEEAEDMILIIKDSIEKVINPNQDINQYLDQETVQASANNTQEPVVVEKPEPIIEQKPDPIKTPEPAIESPSSSSPSDNADLDVGNLISNEMLDQYLTGTRDLLETVDKNLVDLEKDPKNSTLIAETFGAVHSIKGNSGFMGFSEIEEIGMEMETILDSVRTNALDIDANIVTILLSNTETIRKRLDTFDKSSNNSTPAEDIAKKDNEKQNTQPIQTPAPIEQAQVTQKPETKNVQPVEAPKPEKQAAVAQAPKPKANVAPANHGMTFQQKKDIRVDTAKIDKLFALVGELITIESVVSHSPDLVGLELPNFSKSASMLNKISRELQEVSMSIRMMPLEGTFNKMKRLVRDVSIKMNKKIELTVFGQQTEMDKNVIDEISDPLMHILRNSVDHGIETPEERVRKNKSEIGNVILGARYEGNEILISVEDDGAGINRELVLKKAIEKGILKKDPELMTDKEINALIFEPGFSTAKEVTDISGRGVGMDVVRKNLEKLRGSIDVASELNKGTKVTLRIPLTLAIIESMVIKIGNTLYALPILSLRESFRPKAEMINKTMDGLEVVKVRQEVLPVIRLHEEFHIEDALTNLTEGILLIIESKDKKVCLFADDIVGQQQAVVKGFSTYIGKVSGITGCMVTGDGGIGLILDIEGLINMAEFGENKIKKGN